MAHNSCLMQYFQSLVDFASHPPGATSASRCPFIGDVATPSRPSVNSGMTSPKMSSLTRENLRTFSFGAQSHIFQELPQTEGSFALVRVGVATPLGVV